MASLVQEPSSISQTLNTEPRPLRIGLDIGSTTVKAVVLDDSDSLDATLVRRLPSSSCERARDDGGIVA